MVDQLAAEYAANGKPVVFLEQNVDSPLGSRYDRWWAAHGSGSVSLPLVMIDSGNWFSSNYLGAAAHDTYAAAIEASLARAPGAEIVARHQRSGNGFQFTIQLTNRTGVVLSSSNRAAVHAVVYEENKGADHLTGRIVRAVVSQALDSPLPPDASTTLTLDTGDIAAIVDWGKVKAVALLDYRPGGTTGAYDMLQASPAVAADNHAPVAGADSYTTAVNGTLSQAAPGVLANDTDSDGDPLTAVKVSGPAHGTLTLNASGSFTYVPATGFTGADSFTYKSSDGLAESDPATVSITVTDGGNPVTRRFASFGALDGWVLESTRTSRRGNAVNSVASVLRVGDDNLDRQYRGVLSFDTRALPEGAVVIGAALKLHLAGKTGTIPFRTHAPLIADIRSGWFGTSLLLQPADFQAPASLPRAATFGSTPAAGWYTAALAGEALRFINRGGVTQLRVRFTREDNADHGADFAIFHSGNAPAGVRPALTVTYGLP